MNRSTTWTAAAIERHVIHEGDLSFAVGFELARDEDRIRYVATASYLVTGAFNVILEIRRGPAREDDEGMCELGPVVRAYDTEFYGADLIELRDAGARLSWEAAQWLYEVADERERWRQLELVVWPAMRTVVDAVGNVPGWRERTMKQPHPDLPRPTRDRLAVGVDLVELRSPGLASADRRAENIRSRAARVRGQRADAPPSSRDRLLRDPDPRSGEVLRNLLLERGQPVEPLLRDRVQGIDLPTLPLLDTDTIDDELAAL